MTVNRIRNRVILAAALLLCLSVLTACTSGRGTTTPEEFEKACVKDGLAVTLDADPETAPFPEKLVSYATAGHSSEDSILVQYLVYSDEDAAAAAYAALTEEADPGVMGTMYQNVLKNYTVTAAQADSYYTKLILSGTQVLTAKGATRYKSELDRIILKLRGTGDH